jgi:hypothetical protein
LRFHFASTRSRRRLACPGAHRDVLGNLVRRARRYGENK